MDQVQKSLLAPSLRHNGEGKRVSERTGQSRRAKGRWLANVFACLSIFGKSLLSIQMNIMKTASTAIDKDGETLVPCSSWGML